MYYCTQKVIHRLSCIITHNICISLAKKLQGHLSKDNRKHVFFDQGKYRKRASKRKWTDREYHIQDNDDVAHKYVKIYCNTNQFPELPPCGTHPKPRGARGFIEHYNLSFDPKRGHGIYAICRIPFVCVACTSMLDHPWISSIPSKKQARYQPVTDFTYWT